MRRRKAVFPVKAGVSVLIIILALFSVLGYIWRILTTADYFKVTDIVTKEALSLDLSYLKGRNIFSLNLPKESYAIARSCPDCSRVRLARVLPNRVFVELVKRRPVAFIKLYRYFAVDENAVLFASSLQPDASDLPVITGLETKIFGPKPGNRYQSRELAAALSIIREAARTRLLRDYKISRINVAGIDNITLQIPITSSQGVYTDWKPPEKNQFLEIKVGEGDMRNKIAIIAGLINQEKRNLNNIKYIDLRFNETVIKFKDAK